MSAALVGTVCGVLSGLATVLLLQAWPFRHRWSEEISWTVGEPSGLAIHQVKIGRRERRVWKRRRSPIDVSLRARVAVKGIGYKADARKIVDIPVDKPWRPILSRTVLVKLLPEECKERELRYFPERIRRKRAEGTLRLDDLLSVGDAQLRVYAFAYRPYLGTRWMRRATYTSASIRPGVYDGMRVVVPADGRPPRRPDLSPGPGGTTRRVSGPRPAERERRTRLMLRLGSWTLHVGRDESPTVLSAASSD